jgi:starvation-inducible DNA-binding protein
MEMTPITRAGAIEEGADGAGELAEKLNFLLADIFALYLKTKSFHWHVSGPSFRDYHLLLDEQAGEVFAMTDIIAERVRKLGEPTLRSIDDIHRLQRTADASSAWLDPSTMVADLLGDNRHLVREMRSAHKLSDLVGDIATASVLETFIDEGERRVWFLREMRGERPLAL